MLNRPTVGTQRPHPPNRVPSGGVHQQQQVLNRPSLPSRLSGAGGTSAHARNTAAFKDNHKQPAGKEVIDLEDENIEPPAKRTKHDDAGQGGQITIAEGGDGGEETNAAHKLVPGLPLPNPPKPCFLSGRSAGRGHRVTGGRIVNGEARRAHGAEPPAMATRLPPPKNVADFSPWCGAHPEDILNEQVIKSGYFDKGPGANQSESNTARPAIWPSLSQKNNVGLQQLSHLFVQVIEKRQTLGRCTAPSTFKPPPRVTVTDTKREAWLRDLASPDVPLRKQSRTIPHGIRGKMLLEQCLNKKVPLQRAVWLSKCVGANELRAFRRKGVSGSAAASGEQKWIREWTIYVEQFVESVVASCGQPEWQQKMDYSIRLASHFFQERLLDSEHYLDWLVASFASSTTDRLPVWLVLAQIYWKDLVAYSRRGRRLAESLLAHLHHLHTKDQGVKAMLTTRLQRLVAVLAVARRGCLVMPKTWDTYKYLLTLKSNPANQGIDSTAQNIVRRNERLVSPIRKSPTNTKSALLDLYSELDNIRLDVNIGVLTARCYEILPNDELVVGLLDWASSLYREGLARVYLAAKILGHMHGTGVDTDAAILAYFNNSERPAACNIQLVYKVIVELVRAKSFSVGRYLQWLITAGSLSGSRGSGLITFLPIDGLPAHLINTRAMMIKRLDLKDDEESAGMHTAVAAVRHVFVQDTNESTDSLQVPSDLSGTARLSLSRAIHNESCQAIKESGISPTQFCIMRNALEALGDYSTLAAFTSAAIDSSDPMVLASAADTANFHAESFAALGVANSLLERLLERHRALRAQQPLDRTFLIALCDLTKRLPQRLAAVRFLSSDLSICERQSSSAVCSPASDNMVGMQISSIDSDDDIDQIFASGNTMDEQLMARVFGKIMDRAGKPADFGVEPLSRVSSWLVQLRSVDGSHFDVLARNYMERLLMADFSPRRLDDVISSLIASDCMGLEAFMHLFWSLAKSHESRERPGASKHAAAILQMLTMPAESNPGLTMMERYHCRLQLWRYCEDNITAVVRLLCLAYDTSGSVVLPGLMPLFKVYGARDYESFVEAVNGVPDTSVAGKGMAAIMTYLVRANTGHSSPSHHWTILHEPAIAVRNADELSLPFCKIALRLVCGSLADISDDAGEAGLRSQGLKEAVKEAVEGSCNVYPQLLGALDEIIVRSVHEWAQEQVLFPTTIRGFNTSVADSEKVNRYMNVMGITSYSVRSSDQGQAASAVYDKLRTLQKRLDELEGPLENQDSVSTDVCNSLHTMLHLAVLQHQLPPEDDPSLRLRVQLLSVLSSLLVHTRTQQLHDVLEYTSDVIAALSDDLSEEAMTSLSRQCLSDPRLIFLFGPSTLADSWLALASRPQVSTAVPVGQRPGTNATQPARPPQQKFWTAQAAQAQSSASAARTEAKPEVKMAPFPLRRWEIMPDPAPNMGENDTSLSLALFGARKV